MAYIEKSQIANSKNYGGARNVSTIKYIIIHYTGNDGDTDESNGKYFANNILKASAHDFVDDDSITHSVPHDHIAYSVGGSKYSDCAKTGGGRLYKTATNSNSINIELCDTVKNGTVYPSQATINNAIAYVKVLMAKYGIDADHVIRHFDVNGKYCPAYWMDNTAWENEFHSKLTTSTVTTSTAPKADGLYRVRKSWNDTKSQLGAYSNLEYAKEACKSGYTVYDSNGNAVYTKTAQSSAVKVTPSTTAKYTYRAFVEDVQKALGTTVDGVVGKKTFSATITVSKDKNRKHAVVKPIQKYLNSLGYDCGEVDGIAGNKFDAAVKKYQTWMKKPDGEITAKGKTWRNLLNYWK